MTGQSVEYIGLWVCGFVAGALAVMLVSSVAAYWSKDAEDGEK